MWATLTVAQVRFLQLRPARLWRAGISGHPLTTEAVNYGILPQNFHQKYTRWRRRSVRHGLRSDSGLRPNPKPQDLAGNRDPQHLPLLLRQLRRHYLYAGRQSQERDP